MHSSTAQVQLTNTDLQAAGEQQAGLGPRVTAAVEGLGKSPQQAKDLGEEGVGAQAMRGDALACPCLQRGAGRRGYLRPGVLGGDSKDAEEQVGRGGAQGGTAAFE